VLRKLLLVAGLMTALVLSSSGAAEAAYPHGVPAQCVAQPGRFQVLPIPGAHHDVLMATVGMVCTPAWPGVVSQDIEELRYWVSTKTWTLERHQKYVASGQVPAMKVMMWCATPGALMGMRVIVRFWKAGVLVTQQTYAGRTTALCPR
jgi:hypothetical protein